MAYEPGKPWDPSLTYSLGQTCIYNGLPYICFSGYGSNVGTPPNEEMAIYDAYDPSTGTRVSTTDRTWVLCSNDDVVLPNYGNRFEMIKDVRGLPTLISAYFENPQGIKVKGSEAETNARSYAYYGYPSGMSVEYAGGTIYVGTYAGIQDNPFDPYYSRPDQRGQYIIDIEVVSDNSSGLTLKALWMMGENKNVSIGGADTAANMLWFERTYSYTITVNWYNSSDTLLSTLTDTGTVTSPSLADGWTEVATYGPEHFFARPSTAAYADYSIAVTSVSPSIDA